MRNSFSLSRWQVLKFNRNQFEFVLLNSAFLFGVWFRNCGKDVSTLGTNRLPRHIGFILFRQVSFRNEVTESHSHSLFHGSYGEPDSRMLATLPFRMHGEQIVNNTKQPRQTNIAFGFTGDTHVLVTLLPHGKLLYRANTLSVLSRRLVGRDVKSKQ